MGSKLFIVLLAVHIVFAYTEDDEDILKSESRQARQVQDYPRTSYVTSRQVIKVPNNARIKIQPQYLRPTRGNRAQQPKRQQKRPKRPYEDEELYEEPPKKGFIVKDVSPEEFYEEEYIPKKYPKKYRKPDSSFQASNRRPVYDEDTGYEFTRTKPRKPTYYDDVYDDYAASSAITMKQVPPPNLAQDFRKEGHSVKKQMKDEYYERYETENHKKPPTNRQIHYPEHYTTHNPHVTQTFGLEGPERTYYGEQEEPEIAASDQRPTLLPTGSSGIHIVKPPQFRDVVPTTTNQRATIRDIIQQDCRDAEALGFCASPPRYPTQQINSIMGKCGDLIDAMYSSAPIDPEDDLSSFSERSDEPDIDFIQENSDTNTSNIFQDWSKWSRSNDERPKTACSSILTQTEPGYAREITSGRWFVVMQTMDKIVQRVMTDTCQRPGKPCQGFAGLKCSRNAPGYKATRCVQRYTQHRLISWDPEMPQNCPKIRVFQFPTACLCHLSTD